MIEIPLGGRYGRGKVALVDDEDFEFAEFRWYLAKGYVTRNIWVIRQGVRVQRQLRLARAIVDLPFFDKREVDHWNGNKLDNRRENLRIVTHQLNSQNQGSKPGTSSKYRGVCWHKGKKKWTAQVNFGGNIRYLGAFEDEHEAGRVASEARKKILTYTNEARYDRLIA